MSAKHLFNPIGLILAGLLFIAVLPHLPLSLNTSPTTLTGISPPACEMM